MIFDDLIITDYIPLADPAVLEPVLYNNQAVGRIYNEIDPILAFMTNLPGMAIDGSVENDYRSKGTFDPDSMDNSTQLLGATILPGAYMSVNIAPSTNSSLIVLPDEMLSSSPSMSYTDVYDNTMTIEDLRQTLNTMSDSDFSELLALLENIQKQVRMMCSVLAMPAAILNQLYQIISVLIYTTQDLYNKINTAIALLKRYRQIMDQYGAKFQATADMISTRLANIDLKKMSQRALDSIKKWGFPNFSLTMPDFNMPSLSFRNFKEVQAYIYWIEDVSNQLCNDLTNTINQTIDLYYQVESLQNADTYIKNRTSAEIQRMEESKNTLLTGLANFKASIDMIEALMADGDRVSATKIRSVLAPITANAPEVNI